jgi:hypothetical protein
MTTGNLKRVVFAALCTAVICPLTSGISAAQSQMQFCALYRGGNQQCGFLTFESCQQTASGLGGMCIQTTVNTRPNLLQQLEQRRQQDSLPADFPGDAWVPPPPNN